MSAPLVSSESLRSGLQATARALVRGFHAYGTWLVGVTWRRFAVLALLLLIGANVVQNLPPFSWKMTETVTLPTHRKEPAKPQQVPPPHVPPSAEAPVAPKAPPAPAVVIERPASGAHTESVSISIDERGLRILRGPAAVNAPSAAGDSAASAAPAASVAPGAAPAPAGSAPGAAPSVAAPATSKSSVEPSSGKSQVTVDVQANDNGVRITLPPGADAEAVREAVDEARQAILEALREARDAREEAAATAREAADEAAAAAREAVAEQEPGLHIREVRLGDFLPDLALFWIVASAILKITYKGRIQAEAKAAQATETAESESLRRQVVEARMAAMQAQVEPHFLFNTLASIDHLIETDPPRASQMQRNLIALLRASMPTLRDTADGAARDLGRELAVVRPYVEILKVRMEERLDAHIEAPEGLLSAEFPAMMIQTLVENAIRHGLEPKPEGGRLEVRAEIVHGKLSVTVADTGVGFGRGGTAGTGVGLANIRERLQLLYGREAQLTISANQPCGTRVVIAVPYRAVAGAGAVNAQSADAATSPAGHAPIGGFPAQS